MFTELVFSLSQGIQFPSLCGNVCTKVVMACSLLPLLWRDRAAGLKASLPTVQSPCRPVLWLPRREWQWCGFCRFFSLSHWSFWQGHSMNPFNLSVWPHARLRGPLPLTRRHNIGTKPLSLNLYAWVEFFPGGCADPSRVKTSGTLALQNVQRRGSFLTGAFARPLHPMGRGSSVARLPCCLPRAGVPGLVS